MLVETESLMCVVFLQAPVDDNISSYSRPWNYRKHNDYISNEQQKLEKNFVWNVFDSYICDGSHMHMDGFDATLYQERSRSKYTITCRMYVRIHIEFMHVELVYIYL